MYKYTRTLALKTNFSQVYHLSTEGVISKDAVFMLYCFFILKCFKGNVLNTAHAQYNAYIGGTADDVITPDQLNNLLCAEMETVKIRNYSTPAGVAGGIIRTQAILVSIWEIVEQCGCDELKTLNGAVFRPLDTVGQMSSSIAVCYKGNRHSRLHPISHHVWVIRQSNFSTPFGPGCPCKTRRCSFCDCCRFDLPCTDACDRFSKGPEREFLDEDALRASSERSAIVMKCLVSRTEVPMTWSDSQQRLLIYGELESDFDENEDAVTGPVAVDGFRALDVMEIGVTPDDGGAGGGFEEVAAAKETIAAGDVVGIYNNHTGRSRKRKDVALTKLIAIGTVTNKDASNTTGHYWKVLLPLPRDVLSKNAYDSLKDGAGGAGLTATRLEVLVTSLVNPDEQIPYIQGFCKQETTLRTYIDEDPTKGTLMVPRSHCMVKVQDDDEPRLDDDHGDIVGGGGNNDEDADDEENKVDDTLGYEEDFEFDNEGLD